MKARETLLARLGAPESAPPWSLTTVALTVLIAFIAVVVGTGAALVWLEGRSYARLAGWTLGGIVTAVFVWQTRRSEQAALRLQPPALPILFVMFISVGCAIAFDLLSLGVTGQFLPRPELLGLNPGALGVLDWGFAIAFMVIVQPVAEELVFRGVAFAALRSALGAWPGLIASALIYAVFHLLAYPPDYLNAATLTLPWYGLILPLLDGLAISLIRAYTGSTRAAIAAHAAFGIFAVVKLLTLVG